MKHAQHTPPGSSQNLDSLGLDAFEKDLLCLLRCFLTSFEIPESQTWNQGFSIAVEKWGERLGLPIAFATAKLVRAVLRCRSHGLYFHDPFDPDARGWATADESDILVMLHHMRRDETPRAREVVLAVTQDKMDPDVIRAALSFAARFSCGAQPDRSRAHAPTLRVVK